MKPSKYKNKKTVVDGITFDSQREAKRWSELKLMERGGLIRNLRRQTAWVLAPSVKLHGEARARPPIRYVADFDYYEGPFCIVEDVKGVDTPMSRLKRHMLKYQYAIDVRIIR